MKMIQEALLEVMTSCLLHLKQADSKIDDDDTVNHECLTSMCLCHVSLQLHKNNLHQFEMIILTSRGLPETQVKWCVAKEEAKFMQIIKLS